MFELEGLKNASKTKRETIHSSDEKSCLLDREETLLSPHYVANQLLPQYIQKWSPVYTLPAVRNAPSLKKKNHKSKGPLQILDNTVSNNTDFD